MPRSLRLLLTLLCVAFPGALAFVQNPTPTPRHLPPKPPRPTLTLQVGHSEPLRELHFMLQGRMLVTTDTQTVRFWDTRSGSLLLNPAISAWPLAFSSDGRTMWAAAKGLGTGFWDVQSGRWLHGLKPGREGLYEHSPFDPKMPPMKRNWNYASSVAFSPDGKTLATGQFATGIGPNDSSRQTGAAALWDVQSGEMRAVFDFPCEMLAFSPDSRILATVEQVWSVEPSHPEQNVATVRLWDVQTRRLIVALPEFKTLIHTLAFSPEDNALLTGGYDGIVQLWDTQTRQPRLSLPGYNISPVFSPDGKTLATTWAPAGRPWSFSSFSHHYLPEARLWDARTGQLKTMLNSGTVLVESPVFSPDGRTLVTVGTDYARRSFSNETLPGLALLWDTTTGRLRATLKDHREEITAIAFSPDGKTLATGSADKTARLWNVADGQSIRVFKGHTDVIQSVAISPDGRTLATGNGNAFDPNQGGEVRLWDLETGQLKAVLLGHTGWVERLAFSPDGKTLATGVRGLEHYDGQKVIVNDAVKLWDVQSGQLKATLHTGTYPFQTLAFSPDGKTLATGGDGQVWTGGSGRAWLWDVESGQLKATLEGQSCPITVLAFSPDGRTLATGDLGSPAPPSEVRLWNVAGGQLRSVLMDAEAPLGFSPDSRLLATNSRRDWMDAPTDNGHASLEQRKKGGGRIWDVESGQLKTTLNSAVSTFSNFLFSPNGKLLASDMGLWDVASGHFLGAPFFSSIPPAFSADSKTLLTWDPDGKVTLYDVTTARPPPFEDAFYALKQIPITPRTRWDAFPRVFSRRVEPSMPKPSVSLLDGRNGRVLATMLPIPEVAEEAALARPIEVIAKPIEVIAKDAPGAGSGEWFVSTPEGYFDCSANAARFIKWNVNGTLVAGERYLRRFRRPDLVRKALRGEKINAPEISNNDIPPATQFVGLKDGGNVSGASLTVPIEVRSRREVKEVELLVNGRPLPPEQARPIEVIAKPIEAAREATTPYRLVKRFTFCVPLPVGAPEVRLRAVAYDDTDLGSDPVEIVFKRSGVKPTVGDLYVLSVGVSRYQNADGRGFRNLQFPAIDARAIGERFQREGKPLYAHVQVRTLTDAQATAANIRAELKQLQARVHPGQVDTVVVYLSGHGYSSPDGRYYFATHDFDLKHFERTGLSGKELKQALGGSLRAKNVFLFVDTCHSGGLRGRNDDLIVEVGAGVYVMTSSGAEQYAYESPSWGHGAFTLALLHSLDRRDLGRDGVIYFNALPYAVPDEVAALMKTAGRNETEQQPRVPLAALQLRVPIASSRP